MVNPTAAQRKNLAMGVNAGQQRQSSYGPHPSNGSTHYKQNSREFQKSPVTMGNNNINTKRSSNSAI